MGFAQVLARLMQEGGVSAYKLAKSIGVHQTTIKNWLEGKQPRTDHLDKVAGYFGASTDFLLGNAPKKESPPPVGDELEGLNEEQRELVQLLSGMDDQTKAIAFAQIEALIEQVRKNGQ